MAAQTYPVTLQVEAESGLSLPVLRIELEALGSDHPVPLFAVEDGGMEGVVGLGEAPRLIRVRTWCGEGEAQHVCGELLHVPDSTTATRLSLVVESEGDGWQVLVATPRPGVPLLAQAGAGTLLVLLVGVATLRRLSAGA